MTCSIAARFNPSTAAGFPRAFWLNSAIRAPGLVLLSMIEPTCLTISPSEERPATLPASVLSNPERLSRVFANASVTAPCALAAVSNFERTLAGSSASAPLCFSIQFEAAFGSTTPSRIAELRKASAAASEAAGTPSGPAALEIGAHILARARAPVENLPGQFGIRESRLPTPNLGEPLADWTFVESLLFLAIGRLRRTQFRRSLNLPLRRI
jgi:hypothetical protein